VILEAALLGGLTGWLMGGGLRWARRRRVRALPLVYCALAVEGLVGFGWPFALFPGASARTPLLVSAAILKYGIMAAFFALNLKRPGMPFMLAGNLANALVVLANGGRMPIGPWISVFSGFGEEARSRIEASPDYFLAEGNAHLLFLGDVLPFRGLFRTMISPGDILVAAGLFLFVVAWLRRPDTRSGHKPGGRDAQIRRIKPRAFM